MGYLRLAKRFDIGAFQYAHRGLWAPDGPDENSLEACLKAAQAGYGIEFDVRPSKDGVPILFHDRALHRMTGEAGSVDTLSANNLEAKRTRSGAPIITLQTLLEEWPGKTPLLCEMKIDGQTSPEGFAETVADLLLLHEGPAAAMSFSTKAVDALPDGLMRGQLIEPKQSLGEAAFEAKLSAITAAKSDYIAGHTSDARILSKQARAKGLPVIVWTVRDMTTFNSLEPLMCAQIFEGFRPDVEKARAASIS